MGLQHFSSLIRFSNRKKRGEELEDDWDLEDEEILPGALSLWVYRLLSSFGESVTLSGSTYRSCIF